MRSPLILLVSCSLTALSSLTWHRDKEEPLPKGPRLSSRTLTHGKPTSFPGRSILGRIQRSGRPWESPLIQKGIGAGVTFSYHTLIDQMDLNEEETSYFTSLLRDRTLLKGTYELKLASDDHEPKQNLLTTLETDLSANTKLIRQFLNHEDDFQLFLRFESELPERTALSPFQDALSLHPGQQDELFKLLQSARAETEEKFGHQFETSGFLRQFDDLKLLKMLRDETDRRIQTSLPDILDPQQAEVFTTQWKTIRAEQLKASEFTVRLIREENS